MDDMTERQLVDWLIETCLMFGASLATALFVAGHFIADPAIARRWRPATPPVPDREEDQKP